MKGWDAKVFCRCNVQESIKKMVAFPSENGGNKTDR